MKPSETAAHYDDLAHWWQSHTPEDYGIRQLERALRFTSARGPSLDVGCGSSGRFIRRLRDEGFQTEGIDVSTRMIALARELSPESQFDVADICSWEPSRAYDFISAWDSTFHLPLASQEPVLRKLCAALAPGGVLIFTCGGGPAGEITGTFQDRKFGYSTLGVETFVRILHEAGCCCRHVEYDQYPEQHVYVIAQKNG